MITENKILRLFIEDKKEYTIREISKKINSDYKITHTAINILFKKGIVEYKKIGKSSLCYLNKTYYGSEIYNIEMERKLGLLKNKTINQLYKEIMDKIRSSFFIFIIFGSYASYSERKNSDIDIIFISNEKRFEEKIDRILSLLPLKIHALTFNEEEFKKMINSREQNVIKEMLNNYIILYGIENFYRLKND